MTVLIFSRRVLIGLRRIGWCSLFAAMLVVRNAVPAAVAQTPATAPSASKVKTFVSPDGAFQFDYPDSLLTCKPEATTHTFSYERACAPPMCDEYAVACLAYPYDEYRGYNFTGANFSVAVLKGPTTQLACLAEVDRNTCRKPSPELLNGVRFGAADCGEGGLGHSVERRVYRTYHRGACYQLSIGVATTAFQNYDPGTIREFTQSERQKVVRSLRTSLQSFRFRK